MDRLDTINSYFNKKERARLNDLIQNTSGGLPVMSKEEIRLTCLENDGYDTPELNEKLYLHFRGYKRIENLEEYTACKALWLDSNGFELIENLDHLPLRCLYLSKNLINKMQGLVNLSHLVTLDLSHNRITNVEGLEGCVNLKTINLSRNALSSAEALQGLTACPTIDNIDVTNNRIEGDIIPILTGLPTLHAISINGNPCTQTKAFRKRTIAAIPTLSYLDRPVDEIEKLGANAYVTEGPEKEQEVRLAYIAQQKQARSDELNQFRTWQREQLALRKEKLAAGITEGVGLITEFTPEEKAQRDLDAQNAADREREMLDMGIGKLGQKYWQLQGRDGCKEDGVDLLEKAVDELKGSKEQQEKFIAANDSDSDSDSVVEAEEVRVEFLDDEENEDVELVTAAVQQGNVKEEQDSVDHLEIEEGGDEEEVEDDDDDEDGNDDTQDEVDNSPNNAVSITQAVDKGIDDNDNTVDEEDVPEWVHQQRVQESLAIYQRQRELEKKKKEGTQSNEITTQEDIPSVEAFTSTQTTIDWNFETSRVSDSDARKKVYWTEWMDLKLAEFVQNCVFDFSAVSEAFQGMSNDYPGCSTNVGAGREVADILSSLSEEDCRLRWAELDSKQWCGTDCDDGTEDVTAPPVYRVCVKPDVLGKGHGAQPSFAAMTSMANGIPSYLKVPTSFPSVLDNEDDHEDEDIENAADNFQRFEELD